MAGLALAGGTFVVGNVDDVDGEAGRGVDAGAGCVDGDCVGAGGVDAGGVDAGLSDAGLSDAGGVGAGGSGSGS